MNNVGAKSGKAKEEKEKRKKRGQHATDGDMLFWN
jgi:hypothetical protein